MLGREPSAQSRRLEETSCEDTGGTEHEAGVSFSLLFVVEALSFVILVKMIDAVSHRMPWTVFEQPQRLVRGYKVVWSEECLGGHLGCLKAGGGLGGAVRGRAQGGAEPRHQYRAGRLLWAPGPSKLAVRSCVVVRASSQSILVLWLCYVMRGMFWSPHDTRWHITVNHHPSGGWCFEGVCDGVPLELSRGLWRYCEGCAKGLWCGWGTAGRGTRPRLWKYLLTWTLRSSHF